MGDLFYLFKISAGTELLRFDIQTENFVFFALLGQFGDLHDHLEV
jgi:hypothetical protein